MTDYTELNAILKDKKSEDLEGIAQAAEAAERYDDMRHIMSTMVKQLDPSKAGLTADQRNLLSVAYKNVVGGKRLSWRNLDNDMGAELDADLVKEYKQVVEAELKDVCEECLKLLEGLQKDNAARLEKDNTNVELAETQVFFLKMSGDYYRYLTEVFSTDDTMKTKCQEYYTKAMDLATEHLKATHPTRLGLALNFSVCYYEILKKKDEACKLAKDAFDKAIEKLDSLSDNSYKDSTLIMQLLRDNLTIWKTDDDGGDEQQ